MHFFYSVCVWLYLTVLDFNVLVILTMHFGLDMTCPMSYCSDNLYLNSCSIRYRHCDYYRHKSVVREVLVGFPAGLTLRVLK
jgi:hypothetical protein